MTHTNEERSVFITGANGGMGIETVKGLIDAGVGRIALACRTKAKADTVVNALNTLNTDKSTILEPYGGFNMNRAEEIKRAVYALPEDKPFNIVFLQSGGMIVSDDYQFIQTGSNQIEKTIYQNVIGAYLTMFYLDKRNLITPHARIVFAGGEGARGIKGMIEAPTFESVEAFKSYIHNGSEHYKDMNALGTSKFMSALLVQKLAVIDSNRTYIWFSPGLTAGTNGLRDVGQPKRFIMEHIGFPFMKLMGIAQGPKQAGQKYVDCLLGKYGVNGDLLGAPEGKTIGKIVDQKPMNNGLTNLQFREAFWEIIQDVDEVKYSLEG